MFEEAWLGVGGTAQQTVLMEAPLKTTDARREEEGGQGRVCLSLCVCVGQCPTVSFGAPSHVFALMASVQAAFWPSKTALRTRLHAHSLTQAATLSYTMHTAYTHTLTPQTPHHIHTHAAHPPGPYCHLYTPITHPRTLQNQVATHTCHTSMYPHIHT